MKKYYILFFLLYYGQVFGQASEIAIKNIYFFGHLEYVKDAHICEKKIWLNILKKDAEMSLILNELKNIISFSPDLRTNKDIMIAESRHNQYKGTIGVGKDENDEHIIIYDPNIFIRGEEHYVNDRTIFKYILLAHELAHIILAHTEECVSNLESKIFRNNENDADYYCGIILGLLSKHERFDIKNVLYNAGVKRFLSGKRCEDCVNYSPIEQRILSILRGFDYAIQNAIKGGR